MRYALRSLRTWSYWRYAIFSVGGVTRVFAVAGALYLVLEMLDFFGMYTKDRYSSYAIFVVLIAAVFLVLVYRRPVTRISYRLPKKDFAIEVQIDDLLATDCKNVVINTNSTFDTEIGNGLISPASLQGQFTTSFFSGNSANLDKAIADSLKKVPSTPHPKGKGKKQLYSIGTVAKVDSHGHTFYLTAMSDLNEDGNAHTTPQMIDASLEALWDYIATKGELGDIAISVMGTGRGRVELPRKKVVERIAQSFATASQDKVFASRLVIYIHPSDAEKHSINLFEIRDFLSQSLHV